MFFYEPHSLGWKWKSFHRGICCKSVTGISQNARGPSTLAPNECETANETNVRMSDGRTKETKGVDGPNLVYSCARSNRKQTWNLPVYSSSLSLLSGFATDCSEKGVS
jgi:hypothetical protein